MKLGLKQKVGIGFLLMALLVTQIPASFVNAIGTTTDFERDGNSIISYTGTASAVSVPNGIQTIAAESFSNHSEIKTVSFPNSMVTIENGAFRGCDHLEQVVLGSGLETLESGAFSMCPNLTKVTFSNNLYQLGAGVFSGDSNLKTIDLNKNPNFILQDGALYNKDKTKLYAVLSGREQEFFKMPDSVTEVERYAFWGCENLRSVQLSANLELIPEYAFSNCHNLEEVSIPFSVRKIAAKAFEDCVSIQNITIPASVSYIHPTAFDGCKNVHIIANEGTTAYEFAKALEESLLNGMEEGAVSENTIGSYYRDTSVVEEVKEEKKEGTTGFDPSKPADMSDADVSEYYALDSSDLVGKTRIVNNQAVVMFDTKKANGNASDVSDMDNSIWECDSVIEDIFDHVLPFKAFYQSNKLSKPELQKGFLSVGDLSFARSSLKAVRLPDGLESIGYGAFYHCDDLKDVDIPKSVTHIGPEAFDYTAYIKNFQKGDANDPYLIVGDGILLAYRGSSDVVILPEEVKRIAGGCFKNHSEITEVRFPSHLLEIGEGAFEGCVSLKKISELDGVQKIADRAFANCPLSQIHLPDSLSYLGLGAFEGAGTDCILFLANSQLPSISYEKTATILGNDVYRTSVFDAGKIAVVDKSVHSFEGTVLDEHMLGHKGLTVSILDDSGKTVRLEKCTMLPEEVTGSIQIPENVKLDGQIYRIDQIHPNAFSAYKDYESWSEIPITSISLPPMLGTIDDYDPSLNLGFSVTEIDYEAIGNEDESIDEDKDAVTEEKTDNEEDSQFAFIRTINSSSYPNAEKALARCLDDETNYQLLISDAKEADLLKHLVEQEYGPVVDGQIQSVDLQMVEAKSSIPISLFGKQQMEIWLPISETLYSQDICVVTPKESGELQTIFGTKQKKDDQTYFVFRTNHFSTYGIYAGIGDVASLIRLESQKILEKDDSPETGEKVNPKWFLAAGLLCVGLVLILNKKKLSVR